MCSLYSINNNSKFSGQSSFQVVLCAKGDSPSSSSYHSSSTPAPCSSSRRKKMKGGTKSPILILASSSSSDQQLNEITTLFYPPSFQSTQPSLPPTTSPASPARYRANSSGNSNSFHCSPSFSYQHQQQRRRQGSNHGTSHWHQFHQHQHHHRHHSLDASFEDDHENRHSFATQTNAHKRASFPFDHNNHAHSIKRSSGAKSNGIRGKDTGNVNARSVQVLNPTNMQTHSKSFFPSQSTPTPTHFSTPLLSSVQQQQHIHHNVSQSNSQKRPGNATGLADATTISFAAAAARSSSIHPSSTCVQNGFQSAWTEMKSLPSDRALATAALPSSTALISTTVVAAVTEATPIATPVAEKEQGAHGSQANPRDRASLVANLVSRDRNSPDQQDSYSNVNSDAPMIEASTVHHDSTSALQSAQSVHLRHPSQQHPYQSSEPIGCSHILDYHFPSLNHASSTSSLSAATAANTAAAAASSTKYVDSPLERKSHLKRKYNRLLAKNAALKATVLQVKSDLALERQKRTTVDQIYLNIRKDLNQRLESEEDKVLSLKADLEQMVAEIKELKDQLATARSRSTPFPISASMSSGFNSRAANGYRIGYDSSTFSLSRGISALGGIHMPHNSALIDGQDDSDEFLFSRPYSSSPRRASVSQSNNKDSTLMSCSDNETDDDEEMEEEDESDDDACGINKGIFLFKKPPTSRRTSISSSMSLRTLTEEIIKEEEEEEEEIGEMDEEDEVDSDLEDRTNNMDEVSGSDAPRTMMEIILQRQQSHSPEDDVEDPPADANETFDTMTHKTLLQAIRSRLTVAQAHLHIEELVLKYDAPLHKTIAAITRALLQWWEMERVSTGGPITGGFGTNLVVINKETGEQVAPKVAIEKKIESFFGPLLLQFVASIDEQKMLLESLGQLAQTEPEGRWLRNHSGILVALYKYDVLDGESILEWWRSLEEPQGVFGHGENNLRSLNSRFIAWLEDEDEESDTESDIEEEDDEEGESDFDSSCSEFESDSEDDDNDDDNGSNCQKEIIGKVTDVNNLKDQDSVVEAILDVAYPSSTPSSPRTTAASDDYKDSEISNTTSNMKRRISFCTKNNLYYSQDGKVHHAPTHKPRKVRAGDMDINRDSEDEVEDEEDDIREDDPVVKKKYDQCPPFRGLMDRDLEIGTMA